MSYRRLPTIPVQQMSDKAVRTMAERRFSRFALLGAEIVRAITAIEVSFGHPTHREKPGQPRGVPVWEFGR